MNRNHFLFLFLASLLLCLCPSESWALTTRTAKVYIENKTGMKLVSVNVSHKFSTDQHKNQMQLSPVGDGKIEIGSVNYNTGFLTGSDWWIVVFIDSEGTKFFSTGTDLDHQFTPYGGNPNIRAVGGHLAFH